MSYQIIDRATAGLVPPSQPLQTMPFPDGIIVHWVGSGGLLQNPSEADSAAVWRNIQRESMAGIRGQVYIDTPYSFGIDPNGLIFEGRGYGNQSAANGTANYNAHAYAICYLGGPGLPLTAAAEQAFLWLSQQIASKWAAISYAKPHSAIFPTDCPGDQLRAYCPVLQANLHTSPAPTPVEDAEDMIILAPARQQHDPTRPAFCALDKVNRQIVCRNGAKLRQPVNIPSSTPIIGWAVTDADSFVVTADTAQGLNGFPAFLFDFE